MKKNLRITAAVLTVILTAVFCLSSCSGDNPGQTNDPSTEETTTKAVPSLEEMSPQSYKKDIPVVYSVKYSDIDKSTFTELAAEKAMISGLDTEHIYKDKNGREYYILTDGSVALTFLSGNEAYSAFYKADGSLKYLGDSVTGWYFTSDGEIDMISHTFVNAAGSDIISYYEPNGTRFVISAAGTYYDDNLDELTPEEQLAFTKRLGGAASGEKTEQ